MPLFQNLVVTDRQATPVNHTLVPSGASGGVFSVAAADASGVMITEKRVSISRRVTGNRVKVTEKWKIPIVATQTINGVNSPVVLRTAYVDCVFTFENLHTEQERKDVLGMFHSAHAPGKVLIEDTIVKNQDIFSA